MFVLKTELEDRARRRKRNPLKTFSVEIIGASKLGCDWIASLEVAGFFVWFCHERAPELDYIRFDHVSELGLVSRR